MIYTCFEMIRDCRANRPEGWSHFVANYVPVIRKLIAHYQPASTDGPAVLERVLLSVHKPEASIFQSMEPTPERWFVAQLRQAVLAELTVTSPAIDLELETLAEALEPLTLVEKQTAWLETMLYSHAETGVLLRMSPETVEKIRGKVADLIRGKVDTWNRALLADNGFALGRTAASQGGEECLPPKPFLDLLDGRTTWGGRSRLDQHVNKCWHCIDHFCRLVEVKETLRGNKPLSDDDAEPFRQLLGVQVKRHSGFKRWLTGKA